MSDNAIVSQRIHSVHWSDTYSESGLHVTADCFRGIGANMKVAINMHHHAYFDLQLNAECARLHCIY